MIEVAAANGRVWMTVQGNRVGFLPDQATDLAAALKHAAWKGRVEAGEVLEAEDFPPGEV